MSKENDEDVRIKIDQHDLFNILDEATREIKSLPLWMQKLIEIEHDASFERFLGDLESGCGKCRGYCIHQ